MRDAFSATTAELPGGRFAAFRIKRLAAMIIRKYCPPASDHNMQITVAAAAARATPNCAPSVRAAEAKQAGMAEMLRPEGPTPCRRTAITLRFQIRNFSPTAQKTDKFYVLIG